MGLLDSKNNFETEEENKKRYLIEKELEATKKHLRSLQEEIHSLSNKIGILTEQKISLDSKDQGEYPIVYKTNCFTLIENKNSPEFSPFLISDLTRELRNTMPRTLDVFDLLPYLAPEKAKWWAIDKTGRLYFYQLKPTLNTSKNNWMGEPLSNGSARYQIVVAVPKNWREMRGEIQRI
jgi:hypothetical protein